MPQPGQPPTWWNPVQLVSAAPEAGLIDTASHSDPAGLGTPSEPAEPLPPGGTYAEEVEVGREDQAHVVTWLDVSNVLVAIGRFFIRSFGGG